VVAAGTGEKAPFQWYLVAGDIPGRVAVGAGNFHRNLRLKRELSVIRKSINDTIQKSALKSNDIIDTKYCLSSNYA
jgi:hypothetical protein